MTRNTAGRWWQHSIAYASWINSRFAAIDGISDYNHTQVCLGTRYIVHRSQTRLADILNSAYTGSYDCAGAWPTQLWDNRAVTRSAI
jgi:hypothetical protein